ncbi:MAG TPA: A/G-specific adenine glycosylase [Quisquiliibacterium sp.]|nr:A/G-specific adenine glycosylase [Quisquiliibacterium sp.]
MRSEAFAARIAAWQRTHGRHDLPWQGTRDPYRRWVSEIMLQQTQVAAVIPFYLRFLERFPDVAALAGAGLDEVLQAWSGLGYYSRARNLHAAARAVAQRGGFPPGAAELSGLPGIGRSTAAAIAVFSSGERAAILDGNVRRVLCRYHGVEGFPGRPAVERRLWEIAERELQDADDVEAYTQGLMDLGATVCTRARPRCGECPVAAGCVALEQGRVGELPEPRPRRELPLRETTMLALVGGAGVLLERRPPAGIWGGLWSLPEVEAGRVGAFAESLGLRVLGVRPLETFLHQFTHFRLRVTPLVAQAFPGADAPVAMDADGPAAMDAAALDATEGGPVCRWLPFAEVEAAALPRPVKTLLLKLGAAGFRERSDAG